MWHKVYFRITHRLQKPEHCQTTESDFTSLCTGRVSEYDFLENDEKWHDDNKKLKKVDNIYHNQRGPERMFTYPQRDGFVS
jgi:hypothetical protein